MSPDHRTVIVTGAAGNLGKAVAQAFADQGAVEPKRKLTAEQAKEERPELAERIREALGSASKSGR